MIAKFTEQFYMHRLSNVSIKRTHFNNVVSQTPMNLYNLELKIIFNY